MEIYDEQILHYLLNYTTWVIDRHEVLPVSLCVCLQ